MYIENGKCPIPLAPKGLSDLSHIYGREPNSISS
uniref:Uncharacterized protein n=1 Tax=Anguilla anguilla TaxID=7936 RepID=A0A0E9P5P0_ANGAN